MSTLGIQMLTRNKLETLYAESVENNLEKDGQIKSLKDEIKKIYVRHLFEDYCKNRIAGKDLCLQTYIGNDIYMYDDTTDAEEIFNAGYESAIKENPMKESENK